MWYSWIIYGNSVTNFEQSKVSQRKPVGFQKLSHPVPRQSLGKFRTSSFRRGYVSVLKQDPNLGILLHRGPNKPIKTTKGKSLIVWFHESTIKINQKIIELVSINVKMLSFFFRNRPKLRKIRKLCAPKTRIFPKINALRIYHSWMIWYSKIDIHRCRKITFVKICGALRDLV